MSLKQHLTQLFVVLLKYNTQETLSFLTTCTYLYDLQKSNNLDSIELPVMMQPMQSFKVKGDGNGNIQYLNSKAEKTLEQMIDSWSGSILQWFNDHKTSTLGGELYFDLTIFSNLTDNPRPVLHLSSLSLQVQYVKDIQVNVVRTL